ncbi:MAG: HAD family hydrolase [Planctomycetota bacterium]|jgi:phosphoglycolate phosphatase-like HAD superfamily hydrolase
MLVLFDIDGTLLLSQGAGTRSMLAAARELFGDHVTLDGVEIAGCMDPLIWNELARVNGLPDAGANHDRFRQTYHRHLSARLAAGHRVELLPGVRELLDGLGAIDGVTLGLLTGNYPETGRLKIQAAGLDPDLFAVAAWGSDGQSRSDLPALAMTLYRQRMGRPVDPQNVVVVGDTPHDVACARAHGCRCLAVATGTYSREKLAGCESDLLLDDLTETDAILDWIVQMDPVQ